MCFLKSCLESYIKRMLYMTHMPNVRLHRYMRPPNVRPGPGLNMIHKEYGPFYHRLLRTLNTFRADTANPSIETTATETIQRRPAHCTDTDWARFVFKGYSTCRRRLDPAHTMLLSCHGQARLTQWQSARRSSVEAAVAGRGQANIAWMSGVDRVGQHSHWHREEESLHRARRCPDLGHMKAKTMGVLCCAIGHC
jgi:hypothetical protein